MKTRKGVLSIEYHEVREKKTAPKYRLSRRTHEVLKAIMAYHSLTHSLTLLDIGTADGLMLDKLFHELNIEMPVGLDFSAELLKTNPHHTSHYVQADAMDIPFKDNAFDVIVATAVIEHVPEPEKMVTECHRVLKQDGICIFTTPDPFFEHVATKIGHLKEEQHQKTFKLAELRSFFESQGFKILKAEKFMMSPIGFPFEDRIESVLRQLRLGCLMCNQLIVCKKNSSLGKLSGLSIERNSSVFIKSTISRGLL